MMAHVIICDDCEKIIGELVLKPYKKKKTSSVAKGTVKVCQSCMEKHFKRSRTIVIEGNS
jgi:hypothetical protein